jgi:hypothetical protein
MKKPSFKPPDTVEVSVHRNGAELRATAKWSDAQLVLQAFLEVYRAATKRYPELIVELPHVGGSSVPYIDDWDSPDNKKKIGF